MVAKEIVRESGGEDGVANMHGDDVGGSVLHRHLECLGRVISERI